MTSIIQAGKTVEEAVQAALQELGVDRADVEIEVLEEAKSGLFGLIGARDALVKVSLKEEKLIDQILNAPASPSLEKKPVEKKAPVQPPVEKPQAKDQEKAPAPEKEAQEAQDPAPAPKMQAETVKVQPVEEAVTPLMEMGAAAFLKDLMVKSGFEVEVEESKDEEGNILLEILGASDRETGVIIGKRGETLDAFQYITSLAMNRARASHDVYQRYIIDINNYRERRKESLIRLAHKTSARAKKYRRAMRLEPMNPYERRIVHSATQSIAGVKTFSEGQEPYRRVIIKPDYDQD